MRRTHSLNIPCRNTPDTRDRLREEKKVSNLIWWISVLCSIILLWTCFWTSSTVCEEFNCVQTRASQPQHQFTWRWEIFRYLQKIMKNEDERSKIGEWRERRCNTQQLMVLRYQNTFLRSATVKNSNFTLSKFMHTPPPLRSFITTKAQTESLHDRTRTRNRKKIEFVKFNQREA